ncbi:MAG: hypothetical protein JSS27_05240 [Planctomycetes bacterium]|nr:hypothetical protein [Planctomycetota bacterium]
MLLEPIEYKFEETAWGVWRRFLYPDGKLFAEFRSHREWSGIPLLHYTSGKSPETGSLVVAKGIVAVGRVAVGILAIGQAAIGAVAVGQLGLGILVGLGQATTGAFCVGQLALGMVFGVGQLATGYVSVGQFAIGNYVLAQVGFGNHVWDARGAAIEAERFFRGIFG